jgi:hypothetical protein
MITLLTLCDISSAVLLPPKPPQEDIKECFWVKNVQKINKYFL